MRSRRAVGGLVFVLGLAFLSRPDLASYGCGIDWNVPVTHFEGVDSRGHVCYSEQIAELDLGDDLRLPLIINFRSDRENNSPYLGKGWILALLDSSFVQTGENAFQMIQPDGWVRPFYRGKTSDSVLDGGPGWKAEIQGNTIVAWAGCGWKLTYTKGKLTRINTPKSRELELIYSAGKVTELREKGATKLTVEFDPVNGEARALIFGAKRLEIALAERPRVQVVAGQNVVAGMDSSLRRVSSPAEGVAQEFEFAVNDKVQPTLKVHGKNASERAFVWNPATKLIIADAGWSYQIISSQGLVGSNAAIERVNPRGQSEYWLLDGQKGQEITQGVDGVKTIRSWFVSGVLAGRQREIKKIENGAERITYQATYDEKGTLLRFRDDDAFVKIKPRSNIDRQQ